MLAFFMTCIMYHLWFLLHMHWMLYIIYNNAPLPQMQLKSKKGSFNSKQTNKTQTDCLRQSCSFKHRKNIVCKYFMIIFQASRNLFLKSGSVHLQVILRYRSLALLSDTHCWCPGIIIMQIIRASNSTIFHKHQLTKSWSMRPFVNHVEIGGGGGGGQMSRFIQIVPPQCPLCQLGLENL